MLALHLKVREAFITKTFLCIEYNKIRLIAACLTLK